MFALLYGIESAKGFILLSGEVGTGKTTIIRALLQRINTEHIVINIIHPRSTFDDVYALLGKKLGLSFDGKNRLESIENLRNTLETLHQEGRRVIVIIDEAHLLSEESLEEIRLLSNIENEKYKLVQIVLVGQNEIYSVLDRDSQKSLKQRIVINRQLDSLSEEETAEYIKHRLLIAGCDHQLFTNKALALIWRQSRGIPRLINQICDNALLIGYALEAPLIDKKMTKEVVDDMAQVSAKKPIDPLSFLKGRKTWAIASAVAVLFVAFGGYVFSQYRTTQLLMHSDSPYTGPQFHSPAFADKVPSEASVSNSRDTVFEQKNSDMMHSQSHLQHTPNNLLQEDQIQRPLHVVAQSHSSSLSDEVSDDSSRQLIKENIQQPENKEIVHISPDRVKIPKRDFTSFSKSKTSNLLAKSKMIKPNDWLASIALREYGSNSETVIDLIQMANESIKNIDKIYHGRKITLPHITRDSMIVEGEGNNFHIHYASFYNFKETQLTTQALLDGGERAFFVPSMQGENQVFRVYVGIFSNRNQAEKVVKKLEFEYLPFL
ncbi:MAG: AAA family ATPase [Thermodesulfobacteriota bacterium]|nr:AAA family ATPase [Thermodesulfobacteriota bacterium]